MSREARTGLLFVMPVLLVTLLTFAVPILGALLLSFTDFDVYALADLRALHFAGLANFKALLGDPLFWRAMGNTLLFAALGVPAAIGASLAAALLLNATSRRLRPLWRVLLFAPYVTTLVATAVVWRFVLNSRSGLLNSALAALGLPRPDWLGDPRLSIPAILLFVTWKVFGYNMIVFTAALAVVPDELHEAAQLDGAGWWLRFRHVTLPAIGPTLLLAALISTAGFFQLFSEPYIMTQGGPSQSTITILYFMFNQGFEWWSLGSACAVAVLLFLATMAITAVQARVGRRLEWL